MAKRKFVDLTPAQMEAVQEMFYRTVGNAFVFAPLSKKDAERMMKCEKQIQSAITRLFKQFSSFK